MQYKILIIEDEKRMRKILELVLKTGGYTVRTAGDGKEGMAVWREFLPDLVFTDLKMPDADGRAVLKFGNTYFKETPVIILTAFGSIPDAVEAMKAGAHDYITKPVDNDLLIEKAKAALRGGKPKSPISSDVMLFGQSKAMAGVQKELELVAGPLTSVLITGESGTGKEMAARTIHRLSDRSSRPIVKINCSAIPRELMESELFGHHKGAFTGATENRAGAFVRAAKGTLFLDEVGDLPLDLQPKLLHAVEDKVITPVGASTPIEVDVKIISATNRNLKEMVEKKRFRSDLFYRLNTYAIEMPPLREHSEDIPELVHYFLDHICREFKRPPVVPDNACMSLLKQHKWPGNVRELKNILERLVLLSHDREISTDMIETVIGKTEPLRENVETIPEKDLFSAERDMIVNALEKCGWNRSQAARYLGITRNTLRYRIGKFNIKPLSGFEP